MAVTQNTYTGNGSTTNYAFTFPYTKTADIKASINGTLTTDFTLANATTVAFNTAPSNSAAIRIFRETDDSNLAATFYAGSAIRAQDLNDNFTQNLYTVQDIVSRYISSVTPTFQGDIQMGQNNLIFEGATDDTYETTFTVADPTADRTITLPNVSGTVITTGDTGTVNSTILAANSVDSSELVDGSIDTSHIGNLQVTTGKLAADCIDQSKIADNAVLTEHISNANITVDKLATSSVQTAKIADNAVTTAKINADAITGAKIADDQINSEHYVDGSIDTAHLANNAVTTGKLGADCIDQSKIADNAVLAAHISNANITVDKLATDSVQTAKIADNAVTTAKIPDNAVTTAKIADAELTTLAGMQSGTASILASGTALTATNAEINAVCDGKSAQTTISDTDASYPTSGAVVDYVAAQIAPLGGLEVIANEDSFPTQPSSGVVISIADAGGIVVNGSGVSTTARTSGNGSDNVTINGFPSTLYSTTLTDNMGLLVSSTGSSNTYTYHKLLGKESDIKTLSDDINDFNARYRIASSAPSSNNDDGDLYFDTTSKKMKVYNAGTSQWDDVAQSSSSHIVTLSQSFNGSLTDFTMSTAATDAQSTIVSINGVIQKPNAGTSTPAEGFAISGNTLKLSNAPATGSTYFIVVLGDTVSIGTPSDNTVSTAKIQNGAVTTDKLGADQVTGAKIADDAVGAEHIEVLDANLQLADNAKIQVGTGDDLEIFHNGDHTYVQNSTGAFVIEGDNLQLRSKTGSEKYFQGVLDGAAELYHDGTKKLETSDDGITVTDNGPVPLKVIRSGSSANCALEFKNDDDSMFCGLTSGEDWAVDDDADLGSGPMFLVERTTGNVQIPNDTGKLQLGASQDLALYHSSGHNYIHSDVGDLNICVDSGSKVVIQGGTSGNHLAEFNFDGAVELFHNGNQVFYTESYGAVVKRPSGGATVFEVYGSEGENAEINLKADDGDDNADRWKVKANASSSLFEIQDYASGSWVSKIQVQGGAAGAVFLNYGTSQKLYTSQYGVNVLGIHEVQANVASNYANHTFNDGNSSTRYGSFIKCGGDEAAGTNYALGVADGDGTTQGYLTFSGGTLALDPFTAAHPCIVPDADNPSDESMAYPYGTLLETITIEYKKKKDGSDTERGILYKVQKTQSANSKKVLGAYAGSLNNSPDNYTNMHHVYVLGDGHILVNNAGGNIEVGDGICSSATAGIGQKATANPSMIIGIAQEAITFTGSETKLVAVQYGLQQFIPWT